MSIDRATLSRVSRKLTSSLDTSEEWRMVRVPVSEGSWSAWKQYCSLAEVSMGRALAALIENELRSLLETSRDRGPVFDVDRTLREREAGIRDRERQVADRERRVQELMRQLSAVQRPVNEQPATEAVGRNERCPCGSGLKYKRCHGLQT